MSEAIETLLDRIDESLRTSDERIIASEESERQSDIYISTSRKAIGDSIGQLGRISDREAVDRTRWAMKNRDAQIVRRRSEPQNSN